MSIPLTIGISYDIRSTAEVTKRECGLTVNLPNF
jgi:hypothetical protein